MAVKTKAQILAEITTLFADNSSQDISASDLRTVCNDIVDSYFDAPYKVHTINATQSSTSAPTATVLQNALTSTITYVRTATGTYNILSSAHEFTTNKTAILTGSISGAFAAETGVYCYWAGDDTIVVETYRNGALFDGLLDNFTIEIRVYS